jgi:hypothetical protein
MRKTAQPSGGLEQDVCRMQQAAVIFEMSLEPIRLDLKKQ